MGAGAAEGLRAVREKRLREMGVSDAGRTPATRGARGIAGSALAELDRGHVPSAVPEARTHAGRDAVTTGEEWSCS